MDETIIPIELDASGKPSKAWLEHMYTQQHCSHKVIAKIAGRSSATIHGLLKRYGIPLRSPSQFIDRAVLELLYVQEGLSPTEIAERLDTTYNRVYHALNFHGLREKRLPHLEPTREWLIQKHFEEKMTWKEIRNVLGYSAGAFHELLKRYDIPRKQYVSVLDTLSKEDLYQLHVIDGLTAVRIATRYGCNPSAIQRLIKRYQLDPDRPLVQKREIPISKEELEHLYVEQKLSCLSISKQYHVGTTTVNRWLHDYGIPVRTGTLPKNGNNRVYARKATSTNRDGAMFTPKDRETIFQRDGYHCQMPNCSCSDLWKLEAHHILPVEHHGTNDLSNGITLCHACHVSIKNRELQYVALFEHIVNSMLPSVQISLYRGNS